MLRAHLPVLAVLWIGLVSQVSPAQNRPRFGRLSQRQQCADPASDTSHKLDSNSFAQRRTRSCRRSRIGFGFETGSSESNFAGAAGAGSGYRSGFDAGAYAVVRAANPWSVQPELFYVQKGALPGSSGAVGALSIDYVELALLLRMGRDRVNATPGESPPRLGFVPFATLGPEVAVEVHCTGSFTPPGQLAFGTTCDGREGVSTADIGVIGGVGAEFNFLGQRFSAVARYDAGFWSVEPNNDFRNRGLSLLIGMRW